MIESPMMESLKKPQKLGSIMFRGILGTSPFLNGMDPERDSKEKRWTSRRWKNFGRKSVQEEGTGFRKICPVSIFADSICPD